MAAIQVTVDLEVCKCANCSILFAIPDYMVKKLRESHDTFYCPSGHFNYYPAENEAEKLRRELKRKEQELANTVVEKLELQSQLHKEQKKLKRVHNGVCPCCNRSFVNLQRHISLKHPELKKK